MSTVMVAKIMSNNRDSERLFTPFFGSYLKMTHYNTDICLTNHEKQQKQLFSHLYILH